MKQGLLYIKSGWILLGFALLFCTSQTVQGQSRKLTKSISEGFLVDRNASINLTNKYGEVIINTWAKDSVVVAVEITAYGKNDESLSKTMAQVDVDFNNFGDLLNIETRMDLNSGFGVENWFAKNVTSKNKITIDYQVTIPDHTSLTLSNRYGNVYIGDLKMESSIRVAHGDLRINELKGTSKINLSFGKGRIKKVNKTMLNLNSAQLDIEVAGEIRIESTASEIEINRIQSLWINSKNDKVLIEEARSVSGRASFSDISIDNLMDKLDLALNYGELEISNINSNFSSATISAKSTNINLFFTMGSYFNGVIKGKEDKMFLTKNFMSMEKSRDFEDESIISLSGPVGIPKPKQSEVTVTNDKGEIKIYLENTGGITNRK